MTYVSGYFSKCKKQVLHKSDKPHQIISTQAKKNELGRVNFPSYMYCNFGAKNSQKIAVMKESPPNTHEPDISGKF